MTSGSAPAAHASMAPSISPATKSQGSESSTMPYRPPCIQPVWPVWIISAEVPASRSAATSRRDVVRLPTMQSVPSTATRVARRSVTSPVQYRSGRWVGGLRTSVSVAPRRWASGAITASSQR